ncbi:MAG: hypothetical protein U9R25_20610 [Chloroflexota bacterium]|nr:hypothetical protein [Chloroflexota bacterium]
MNTQNVTLPLPEPLRFQQMAQATRQTPYRPAVAGRGGGRVARSRSSQAAVARLQELLERQAEDRLRQEEQNELKQLMQDADLLMLRKAHAVTLLRWRGHAMPPAEKL